MMKAIMKRILVGFILLALVLGFVLPSALAAGGYDLKFWKESEPLTNFALDENNEASFKVMIANYGKDDAPAFTLVVDSLDAENKVVDKFTRKFVTGLAGKQSSAASSGSTIVLGVMGLAVDEALLAQGTVKLQAALVAENAVQDYVAKTFTVDVPTDNDAPTDDVPSEDDAGDSSDNDGAEEDNGGADNDTGSDDTNSGDQSSPDHDQQLIQLQDSFKTYEEEFDGLEEDYQDAEDDKDDDELDKAKDDLEDLEEDVDDLEDDAKDFKKAVAASTLDASKKASLTKAVNDLLDDVEDLQDDLSDLLGGKKKGPSVLTQTVLSTAAKTQAESPQKDSSTVVLSTLDFAGVVEPAVAASTSNTVSPFGTANVVAWAVAGVVVLLAVVVFLVAVLLRR